ncbi:cell wall-active antibiotics response protein LiaF [Shimazuella kribbensis]|uniref:cell wall-active antibiotics response protein LiaF n=1 Tax=Shimazuella kribbensis TaxID=139808 RepID=UPI0003FC4CA4|nr:cell wall-active antibiotics response protein LiaF [Shimazuella kribbensis]
MRRAGGIFFFAIGVILLFFAIGLHDFLVSPVVLIFASFICWQFYYRKVAIFLLIFGGLALIDVDLWTLLLSVVLFYTSYKLLWSNKDKRVGIDNETARDDLNLHWEQSFTKYDQALYRKFRLGDMQFELFDLHATNAIQHIHLDLSRAIIPEGETTITLNGVAGRVFLYLPPDLDVSLSTSVLLGESEVFDKKKMGFHNSLQATSQKYVEANRKVKISISFLLADVQVRYL